MGREQFDNTVKTMWVEDSPRDMIVLETVRFTDSAGQVWEAPQGSLVDGASIPRFFWRVIGSPFVGFYRRPSVIHDVYCVTRTRPWQDVHRMFHEAMLADGVSREKAAAMFDAVWRFGPRWT